MHKCIHSVHYEKNSSGKSNICVLDDCINIYVVWN